MKCVVLSGATGGMGLATAKLLVANGYHVFGIDINEPAEKFEGFDYINADVTKEKEIVKALEYVKQKTTEIDAIISMASIYQMGSLVEINEEDFIRIFDINVFGIYRLNKLFLPLLKERGKVLMVSSELAPLDPLPFTGIYGITKSTIEKYAFSLRMELQLLNKQVVVIRPGAVKTAFIDKSNVSIKEFTDKTELYRYNAERFMEIINSVESKTINPEKIAELILKILHKKKPKYLYKINRNPSLLLLNALPKRTQNWIIKKILSDKKKE